MFFIMPFFIIFEWFASSILIFSKLQKTKAYENHFKMDDEQTNLLVTYDSSVASIFQQS